MSPDPDLLSAPAAAALLGLNRKTLYDAAARGEVPHRRVGRRFIFSRSALKAWLSDRSAGCAPVGP